MTAGCKTTWCKTAGCKTAGCKTAECKTAGCKTAEYKTAGCQTKRGRGHDHPASICANGIPCDAMNASSSARVASDGCAPSRVTASPAAAAAKPRHASSGLLLCERCCQRADIGVAGRRRVHRRHRSGRAMQRSCPVAPDRAIGTQRDENGTGTQVEHGSRSRQGIGTVRDRPAGDRGGLGFVRGNEVDRGEQIRRDGTGGSRI